MRREKAEREKEKEKEKDREVTELDKKEKKREKSFVLEMKELKKQIDDEIKREIQAGILDNVPNQRKKSSNLATINVKKD